MTATRAQLILHVRNVLKGRQEAKEKDARSRGREAHFTGFSVAAHVLYELNLQQGRLETSRLGSRG
jgi:hypothetical protein